MASSGIDDDKAHQELAEASPLPGDVTPNKEGLDTKSKDEAMKVLANYAGEERWSKTEEQKLRRKIDRRLLPILCLTYGKGLLTRFSPNNYVNKSGYVAIQYYDKGMIAQAV